MASRKKARRRLPKQRQPLSLERSYAAQLRRIVAACRKAAAKIVSRYREELAGATRGDAIVVDAATPVTRILSGVKAQFDTIVDKARPGLIAQGVDKRVTAFATKSADDVVRGVVTIPTAALKGVDHKGFVRENVALIKSIPQRSFAQVRNLVEESWSMGRNTDVLERMIAERFAVADNRARVIARDQVGKLSGQVTRARHKQVGITSYRWRTSLDERVRHEHAEREGKLFDYDDPPEDGHPGEPVQCRCTAEPVIPDDLGEDDDE